MSGCIRDIKLRKRHAMIDLLERASLAQPDDLALAQRLANASLDLQQDARAIAALERVTNARPEQAEGWYALANLLFARNRAAEALAGFERAVALALESSRYHSSLGFALRTLGNDVRADAAFARALALDPANPYAMRGCGQALMRRGAGQELADFCEAAMPRIGARSWLIAQYMIALARLGRRDAIAWLLDYDGLVGISMQDGFPGFASLDAFHAALREEFEALRPMESGNVPNDVVRDAIRVPLGPLGAIALFGRDGAPASAALMDRIAVQRAAFEARLGECLLLRARPERLTPKSSAVITRQQGYVAPHTHACTWMGVLYYVAVPDSIRRGDHGKAGCMEFAPPYHKTAIAEGLWPSRLVRPEPGMMVMFPGYAYHEVHAANDPGERTVVTIDLYPAGDSHVTGVGHEQWLAGMPRH